MLWQNWQRDKCTIKLASVPASVWLCNCHVVNFVNQTDAALIMLSILSDLADAQADLSLRLAHK